MDRLDSAGRTALHVAASHGHDAICEALLAHEGMVREDEADGRGCTPLHLAAGAGHDAVGALLARRLRARVAGARRAISGDDLDWRARAGVARHSTQRARRSACAARSARARA